MRPWWPRFTTCSPKRAAGHHLGGVERRHAGGLLEQLRGFGMETHEPASMLALACTVEPSSGGGDGITVARVETDAQFDQVREVFEQGDGWSPGDEWLRGPGFVTRYLAFIDGRPVATADITWLADERAAFLGGALTLPEFRGRGAYRALVHEALARSRPPRSRRAGHPERADVAADPEAARVRGGGRDLGADRPLLMAGIDPNVFALADNPNTYTPLGRGDERIVRPQFVLWMGGDGGDVKWSVAQRFRFDRDELDDVIAEVHDLLREHGRDRCSWEVGSGARPPGLPELLLARGMAWDDDPLQIGMVLDHEPEPVPDGVSVRVADTRDAYAASERIARTAFGMQDELSDQQLTALFERSDLAVSRRYLASVDGVDVATGNALFTEHGVVLNAGRRYPSGAVAAPTGRWCGPGGTQRWQRARPFS